MNKEYHVEIFFKNKNHSSIVITNARNSWTAIMIAMQMQTIKDEDVIKAEIKYEI